MTIHINAKIEYQSNADNLARALWRANREFARLSRGSKDIDKNKQHFIYLVGPDVDDLIIFEYNKRRKKFVGRACTGQEWKQYFANYISAQTIKFKS